MTTSPIVRPVAATTWPVRTERRKHVGRQRLGLLPRTPRGHPAGQGAGCTSSPRTSSGPPPRSGTSARRPRGRSSRRPPRSASTRSTSSRSSASSRPASASPSPSRSSSGVTRASGCPSSAPASPPSRVARQRHARADRRVGAADVRHRRRRQARRVLLLRARRRLATSAPIRTRAVYDEAKDEWVLNGTKTWATNGGIANVHVVVASVDPELGSPRPGVLHRPAGHAGPVPGPEVQEARHPRLAHRRGDPGRRARPRPLPASAARRSSTSGSPASARARRAGGPGRDGDLRGLPPGGRRDGRRHRPRRVRVRPATTPRTRAVRPHDRRLPGASRSSSPT